MNRSAILKTVANFKKFNVGICGDLMLDQYIHGTCERISQEAPVPVVLHSMERKVLGGAANVAQNVVTLGAKATPIGAIGKDDAGMSMLDIMNESEMITGSLIINPERITTVKTRILANNQQVVRLDRERVEGLSDADRKTAKKNIKNIIESHAIDALIFEDYAKGVLDAELMDYTNKLAKKNGIITTLDPHPKNAFNIKGITLMTPNRKEAFKLAGASDTPATDDPLTDKPLLAVGKTLMELWAPELLLITLGAQGMILFRKKGKPFHIPTLAKKVFDVSGAGDTVMATMTLALLAGASPEDAAMIANHAAGVVVGLVGTAPIEAEALKATF